MNKMRMMIAAALFSLAALGGCNKNVEPEKDPELPVTFYNTKGDWKLVSWKGQPMGEGIVYLRLKDKKFVMLQNLGSMYLQKFTGEYNLTEEIGVGTTIRGIYDYTWEYWHSTYIISSLTKDKMVWTDRDDEANIQVFSRILNFPEE